MDLSIVTPVYNESQTIPLFLAKMREVLPKITQDYEIIFAVDPSSDGTEQIIAEENKKDGRVKMLRFSRRFGQAAATWAGLDYSTGKAVVVLDCDMQDPPELIAEMYKIWKEGKYKVIIPQRRTREGENFIKKTIAYTAYWVINKIAEVKIPRNCGDFRLMDRVVVNELMKLNESHGFLRGLTAVVGFETYLLPFDRKARAGGKTKYYKFIGGIKMGFNGIFSFSGTLLQLIGFSGFALAAISLLAALLVIILKTSGIYAFASGLATVAVLLLFLAGCQFIALGILGAYIGRIYDEVKMRPKYIVEKFAGLDKKNNG